MAEQKKIGDLTVNDGRGLMDNEGMCDSLIRDLNEMLKNMAAGQYIRVCSLTMEIVQKLMNLQKGIKADRESYEKQLAEMRRLNNELAEKAFGAPAGKDNETIAEE